MCRPLRTRGNNFKKGTYQFFVNFNVDYCPGSTKSKFGMNSVGGTEPGAEKPGAGE